MIKYKDSNLPIGFFDSGVGGLSVYSRFRKILPNENTIYFEQYTYSKVCLA